MRVATLREWQQHQFEILCPAFACAPFDAGDCAADLVCDNTEKLRDLRARFLVPQIYEWLALELASEQRAHPRSGKAEWMACGAVEFQNEHVTKRASDCTRLDLAAFRGRALATPRCPIPKQFAA